MPQETDRVTSGFCGVVRPHYFQVGVGGHVGKNLGVARVYSLVRYPAWSSPSYDEVLGVVVGHKVLLVR